MTVDEIRELIHLASETGIAELEVQRGENRVRIRRTTSVAGSQEIVLMPQAQQVAAPASAAVAGPAPTPAIGTPAPKDPKSDPNLVLVKSPIVGTFYESRLPGFAAVRARGRTRAARQGALHHRVDEADERDRVPRPRASSKASW